MLKEFFVLILFPPVKQFLCRCAIAKMRGNKTDARDLK
jgi:hypothetical protein